IAGAPSFGKMSTFICRMAMIDVSATATTATRIVIGRRMAVNTNHMESLPRGPARAGHSVHRLRSDLFQERREIAMRLRCRQQRAPHPEPRHRVVGLGLREQPLRFRHLGHACESVLITSPSLAFARGRGLTL